MGSAIQTEFCHPLNNNHQLLLSILINDEGTLIHKGISNTHNWN
jgi:hypothetical protein